MLPASTATAGWLMCAYFANELQAEYGLLSQAHYDMMYQRLLKRAARKHSVGALPDVVRLEVAEATTRNLVAQSTVAAVLEFFGAQLAGQLSDAAGRRPVLLLSSLLMLLTKLAPALCPSVWAVWIAKSGGEALNTICTDVLMSSVSDLFASNVLAFSRTAGRLRALGGFGWMVGPLAGGQLSQRDIRLPYTAATLSAGAVALAAVCLPETMSNPCSVGAALASLSWGSCLPVGWASLFTLQGPCECCPSFSDLVKTGR